ncbi:MAG: hypothetical protein K0R82_2926 [Flavipsychrobacter sp.]|jgi:hypothetical protein|nr:hypothetical protein [Flavipsychrobacter sp.]
MQQTHKMYGLFTALALVVIGLVLHFAGLSSEKWTGWLQYGVFLVGILLNASAFSKANDHHITFGNAFSSGFKMTAIVTLIMIAWTLISLQIFPEIKEMALDIARTEMEKQNMGEEQTDKAIKMWEDNFTVLTIGVVLLTFMFWGLVFSLLGAAVAKKKPQQPTTL